MWETTINKTNKILGHLPDMIYQKQKSEKPKIENITISKHKNKKKNSDKKMRKHCYKQCSPKYRAD